MHEAAGHVRLSLNEGPTALGGACLLQLRAHSGSPAQTEPGHRAPVSAMQAGVLFLVSARAWAPAGRRLSQNTSPPELRGMTSRHTTLTNPSLPIEEDERTRLPACPRTLSPPNEACESS